MSEKQQLQQSLLAKLVKQIEAREAGIGRLGNITLGTKNDSPK